MNQQQLFGVFHDQLGATTGTPINSTLFASLRKNVKAAIPASLKPRIACNLKLNPPALSNQGAVRFEATVLEGDGTVTYEVTGYPDGIFIQNRSADGDASDNLPFEALPDILTPEDRAALLAIEDYRVRPIETAPVSGWGGARRGAGRPRKNPDGRVAARNSLLEAVTTGQIDKLSTSPGRLSSRKGLEKSVTPAIDAAMEKIGNSVITLDDLRAPYATEISPGIYELRAASFSIDQKPTLSQRWNRFLIRLGTWLRKLGGA